MKQRMGHCYFIATINGQGSVFQYYHALGSELASRGHRVVILVEGHKYEAENRESNPSVLVWPSRRPIHWRDAFFLRRLIRDYSPACIISCFSAVNICTIVGWLRRVPVRAAWAHTLDGQIRLDVAMSRLKRFLLNRRKRMVYRFATHIIANSEANRRDLNESYGVPPCRVEVVPFRLPDLGIDPDRSRRRSVLYAGRLSPSKGIDILLRALVQVHAAHPDVTVDFIGDGPMRGEYEAMAEELGVAGICTFHGALPKPELIENMATAAILVSPSRREAFGLVNLEAHSVGTPVVATRIDGIPEVVTDDETGLLVPPEDPEALAAAIVRLLENEELRSRLGRGARVRFETVFDIAGIAEQADYFEKLAGDR